MWKDIKLSSSRTDAVIDFVTPVIIINSKVSIMHRYAVVVCSFLFAARYTAAFVGKVTSRSNRLSIRYSASSPNQPQQEEEEEDRQIQWDLFRKYHAKMEATSSWKGVWTTYDYIGDVVDEAIASVNYERKRKPEQDEEIQQTHSIVIGAKRSDCETCFDAMDVKSFPVATYTRQSILGRSRLAANSLVNGPTVLRKSGIMATELALAWGDGRVRVIFQHAPVWEAGTEPGSCPPQGLKLFRVMVSREALRESPPTAETEAKNPPNNEQQSENPIFYRPVPPFKWHAKWSGTSWTWGPQYGNRGWTIDEIDEADSWQGTSPVEEWNLRLPGGVFLQSPRVITDTGTGLCRLAWLPDDETLLRAEAGVVALQPIITEEQDMMVGFHPPSLASLRCDVTKKVGELENVSLLERMNKNKKNEVDKLAKPEKEENFARPEKEENIAKSEKDDKRIKHCKTENGDTNIVEDANEKKNDDDDDGNRESGLQAIRDALQL